MPRTFIEEGCQDTNQLATLHHWLVSGLRIAQGEKEQQLIGDTLAQFGLVMTE